MSKLKLSLLVVITLLSFSLLTPARGLAFDFFGNNVCTTTDSNGKQVPVTDNNVDKSSTCQTASSTTDNPVVDAIQTTTSVVALLAGIVAVIMIIIGGFQIVISGGSTEAVTNGRKKVVNSMIGLVIVSLAWSIIRLITDYVIK
ncbi:MAG TPA: pilin [Candidatus Binatia bacterium]|nr:pilin [Candidatus Binatia bacterium]